MTQPETLLYHEQAVRDAAAAVDAARAAGDSEAEATAVQALTAADAARQAFYITFRQTQYDRLAPRDAFWRGLP